MDKMKHSIQTKMQFDWVQVEFSKIHFGFGILKSNEL